MRLRRFLPSPAMVVAVTALVMSLGGSAYALRRSQARRSGTTRVTDKDIRKRTLTGNDVRQDSVGGGAIKETTLGPVPPRLRSPTGASPASPWSAPAATPCAAAASARSARTGSRRRYQVIFNGDVRNCGYCGDVGDRAPPARREQPDQRQPRSARTSTAWRSAHGNNGDRNGVPVAPTARST